jgi:hypothetical protein
MPITDDEIREAALLRIARLFGMKPGSVLMSAQFERDFAVSFVSDFKRNEFDRLLDDIRDVADRAILRQIESGALVISTVGEYCEHMVRCYKTRPDEVVSVLSAK